MELDLLKYPLFLSSPFFMAARAVCEEGDEASASYTSASSTEKR